MADFEQWLGGNVSFAAYGEPEQRQDLQHVDLTSGGNSENPCFRATVYVATLVFFRSVEHC